MTADELKTARASLGLSAPVFARYIGVTARAVNLWEAGEREMPGPLVVLLDLVLNVKPARDRFLREGGRKVA